MIFEQTFETKAVFLWSHLKLIILLKNEIED